MRLTQRELFPRVWRESESKDGHGGDEEAGHDQVEEVVEGSPPDPHHEGDVKVRLRATVVDHFIPGSGHTCEEHIHFSSSAIENPRSALPPLSKNRLPTKQSLGRILPFELFSLCIFH